MTCLLCGKEPAIKSEQYGWLPCFSCQNKDHRDPQEQIEFTSQSIKDQRKAFANDILQPHNKGELSKEWLNIYGPKKARQRGFTQKEIDHAKPVWNSEHYYKS